MKELYANIDICFNKTLPQHECNNESIYIINAKSFTPKGYKLKTTNHIKIPIKPGQYGINLQFISKEKNIDLCVSHNNTSVIHKLTFNEFLYFDITDDLTIIEGDKKSFDDMFLETRRNNNAKKISFWNTYWLLLHTIAYHYPEEATEQHKKDIIELDKKFKTGGLPCGICTQHYKKYTEQIPITKYVDSQKSLFMFFFVFHNDVNKRNKKKIFTFSEVEELYKSSQDSIKEEFNVDVKELIEGKKINTLPSIMNGPVMHILKKKFKLIE